MRTFHPHHFGVKLWLGCAAGLAVLAARTQAQEYDPDWTRNFRLGVLVGFDIRANFKTSGNFSLSGNAPGIYNDGYVRVDSTGNAQGYTSFWGYQNAAQYDGSHTLTMHSAASFSASGTAVKQSDPHFGLDLAYGGIFKRGTRLRVGWELGFGFLPIKITDNQTLTAKNITRNVYKFDTGGIIVPGAPYNGGSSGIGPTIPAAFTKTTEPVAGSGTITGTRTLDVNLYAIKLGPTLFWDLSSRIGVALSAGPALGIVSGNLKYNETLAVAGATAPNQGEIGATELAYGGYVSAMVTYHTVKNGDFYVGAQYMPMSNTSISGGGRSAELNLHGQMYLSAGINWPF